MLDSTGSPAVWKLATVFAAALAALAMMWGHSENQRAVQLNASMQAAQRQIVQLQKRDLPVTMSFRKALLGPGLVGMFRNNSGTPLEVAANLISEATGQRRTANLVIAPNGVEHLGFEQGWAFAPGQHVVLENSAYRALEFTVPQI